jgi:hypothetical protein
MEGHVDGWSDWFEWEARTELLPFWEASSGVALLEIRPLLLTVEPFLSCTQLAYSCSSAEYEPYMITLWSQEWDELMCKGRATPVV